MEPSDSARVEWWRIRGAWCARGSCGWVPRPHAHVFRIQRLLLARLQVVLSRHGSKHLAGSSHGRIAPDRLCQGRKAEKARLSCGGDVGMRVAPPERDGSRLGAVVSRSRFGGAPGYPKSILWRTNGMYQVVVTRGARGCGSLGLFGFQVSVPLLQHQSSTRRNHYPPWRRRGEWAAHRRFVRAFGELGRRRSWSLSRGSSCHSPLHRNDRGGTSVGYQWHLRVHQVWRGSTLPWVLPSRVAVSMSEQVDVSVVPFVCRIAGARALYACPWRALLAWYVGQRRSKVGIAERISNPARLGNVSLPATIPPAVSLVRAEVPTSQRTCVWLADPRDHTGTARRVRARLRGPRRSALGPRPHALQSGRACHCQARVELVVGQIRGIAQQNDDRVHHRSADMAPLGDLSTSRRSYRISREPRHDHGHVQPERRVHRQLDQRHVHMWTTWLARKKLYVYVLKERVCYMDTDSCMRRARGTIGRPWRLAPTLAIWRMKFQASTVPTLPWWNLHPRDQRIMAFWWARAPPKSKSGVFPWRCACEKRWIGTACWWPLRTWSKMWAQGYHLTKRPTSMPWSWSTRTASAVRAMPSSTLCPRTCPVKMNRNMPHIAVMVNATIIRIFLRRDLTLFQNRGRHSVYTPGNHRQRFAKRSKSRSTRM